MDILQIRSWGYINTHKDNKTELSVGQHCRGNVTMFSGPILVVYCIINKFGVATLFWHWTLNLFLTFILSLKLYYLVTLSRCCCRNTKKIGACSALQKHKLHHSWSFHNNLLLFWRRKKINCRIQYKYCRTKISRGCVITPKTKRHQLFFVVVRNGYSVAQGPWQLQ